MSITSILRFSCIIFQFVYKHYNWYHTWFSSRTCVAHISSYAHHHNRTVSFTSVSYIITADYSPLRTYTDLHSSFISHCVNCTFRGFTFLWSIFHAQVLYPLNWTATTHLFLSTFRTIMYYRACFVHSVEKGASITNYNSAMFSSAPTRVSGRFLYFSVERSKIKAGFSSYFQNRGIHSDRSIICFPVLWRRMVVQ